MNSASLSRSKRASLVAFAFSAVVFMLLIPRARAQEKSDPRASILVSTSWLAKHLNDPDLVLLHIGEKKEYDQGHIPGARFVSLNDISVSDHETPGALMLQILRHRLVPLRRVEPHASLTGRFGQLQTQRTQRLGVSALSRQGFDLPLAGERWSRTRLGYRLTRARSSHGGHCLT